MIKGLTGGRHVVVDGGSTSLPYVNQNSPDSFAGLLRIYGSDLQYYQNGAWVTLNTSYATVGLDGSSDAAIKWAQSKMAFESSEIAARDYMKRRAREFPSLQKALESVERAEANRDSEVKEAIANFHLLDKIAGEVDKAGMMMPQSSP
jgi:hypothetical protein